MFAAPTFTPYVGVAPATTTVAMNGCASCQKALGRARVAFNPYGTEMRLMGLRGTGLRWDLFALALGVGFAGMLGAVAWSKRARSR